MSTKNISISWSEFKEISDLEKDDRDLVIAARDISVKAYAPYSGFLVGAAVRLDDGTIVTGTNVENAAFPSGICAERNALSTAVSNFPSRVPVAIAIAARNSEGLTADPVSPCGNCRQVIAEEEFRNGKPIRIILTGRNKFQVIENGGSLLPLQFNRNSLKSNCL
jgi:cytidine deaminase